MSEIQLKLFQITPSDILLNKSASMAIKAIYDSNLIDDETTRDHLLAATTVRELFRCFTTGSKNENRLMTLALNHVLANLYEPNGWDVSQKGIRVSEFEELATGNERKFLSARFAVLSADRNVNGRVYFNVTLRNRGVFSENLRVESIIDDLLQISGTSNIHLRAFDLIHQNSCVITGFRSVPLFHCVQGREQRWGEFLVARGRMTQIELDRRMNDYHAGQKSEANITMAFCQHGRSTKSYGYPAKDLILVASTSLQGYVDNRRNKKLPQALEEAGDLCETGFKAIRSGMEDKARLFGELERTLSTWFETISSTNARIMPLNDERSNKIRRQEKFSLKTEVSSKEELTSLNSKNVILYPSDKGTVDTESTFLGFFTGPTCQARRLGFEFSTMRFSEKIAIHEPHTIAERVEAAVGSDANLVMAWRRFSNGQLTNNKLVEFELMRRGIAVQHVVDEGQRGNANKVGNLLQGMTEKFALKPNRKCQIELPFDIVVGLDVSRFGGQDIPGFPVMVDKNGKAMMYMPESFDRTAKERRSTKELVAMLDQITQGRNQKILFLRDGYAYEDFEEIATAQPHIELTVLSIRKNLLGAFSADMPSGELYGLYSDHDENRFLFGVNARQGEDARINSLHMVEIVRNPENHSKEILAKVLIELSRQNRTSELEIASLPFPIAYADRTAWVVRDMMQDKMLRKYVREKYTDNVNEVGDEGMFIYSVIRHYVMNRTNGYAFAI